VVTRRQVLPPPNVKFRGTADSRPRNWRRSGIGACWQSPAKSERQQPVWSGRRRRDGRGQQMAGGTRSAQRRKAARRVADRSTSGHPV